MTASTAFEPPWSRSARIRQLIVLAAAACGVSYLRFLLSPLQETMQGALALSDNQIALLQGPALALPLAIGSIPIGLIVDRYRRVPLFLIFIVLGIASVILTAFATGFVALFLARCIAGSALAAVLVAAYSMASDLYASEHRGRATMLITIGETGGGPLAFMLGGLFLSLGLSMAPSLGMDAWRVALLCMGAPLILVLAALTTLREPQRSGTVAASSTLRSAWAGLWRYRSVVLPLLLARVMVWVADGAVLVWGAPMFARQYGLGPESIGGIMAGALLIGSLVGPLIGGPLADLCHRTGGPRRTLIGMAVTIAFSVAGAVFPLMPNAAAAAVAMTVFLTLGYVMATMALAVATIVVPGELRGLYVAVSVTVGALFSIGIAPMAVSVLSGVLGGPAFIGEALAIVCTVTSVIAALVFIWGRRYYPGVEHGHDAGVAASPAIPHQPR